jgi:hypothetical protein
MTKSQKEVNFSFVEDDPELSINQQTVHPSGRQQSITSLLKSLSSSSSEVESNSSSPTPAAAASFSFSSSLLAPRRFLEDLALRSRNNFQSERRFFIEISDGVALLFMILQVLIWISLTFLTAFKFDGGKNFIKTATTILSLLKFGPVFIILALFIALISSVFLYFFTNVTIHLVSLSVLGFNFFNVVSNFPNDFTSGNFASLLTFLFLGLYYVRGLKHLPLTCHFIKSASRICWRNHLSLTFVYLIYSSIAFLYLIAWSASILIIQSSRFETFFKTASLIYFTFSLMLTSAFFRDFLQIWLSRIIYNSTFAYTGRPVIVTSLTKKPSLADKEIITVDIEQIGIGQNSSNNSSPSYEETKRVVSRDSMWWCMGTAARSSLHLLLRAFQIHVWTLALIQVVFPNFGPPANPKCVLDVFHVPTAIYGTSYNKSIRFVEDTMVDHGMDQISVDLYLRTFIYYMISYVCGVLTLLSIWAIFGEEYKFKVSFLLDSISSLLSTSLPIHFASIFAIFGVVLFFTSIDSVHMILCWSICESPTSVSSLEPELMHLLVTSYHARLDLRRFTGDRIRTTKQ